MSTSYLTCLKNVTLCVNIVLGDKKSKSTRTHLCPVSAVQPHTPPQVVSSMHYEMSHFL